MDEKSTPSTAERGISASFEAVSASNLELPPLTDTETARRLLGVTEQYVRRLCRNGAFRCVKVGKSWRINSKSLLEYAGLD